MDGVKTFFNFYFNILFSILKNIHRYTKIVLKWEKNGLNGNQGKMSYMG